VSDIKGALTIQILIEYQQIWDLVDDLVLQPEVDDHHRCHFTQSGIYTAKSAYNAFFHGSIRFTQRRIWKSWGPLNCKFFIWLASGNQESLLDSRQAGQAWSTLPANMPLV
jgi:hypothetical protein